MYNTSLILTSSIKMKSLAYDNQCGNQKQMRCCTSVWSQGGCVYPCCRVSIGVCVTCCLVSIVDVIHCHVRCSWLKNVYLINLIIITYKYNSYKHKKDNKWIMPGKDCFCSTSHLQNTY